MMEDDLQPAEGGASQRPTLPLTRTIEFTIGKRVRSTVRRHYYVNLGHTSLRGVQVWRFACPKVCLRTGGNSPLAQRAHLQIKGVFPEDVYH